MEPLDRTALLILNATTDDYEDLGRIHDSLNLEFSSEKDLPGDKKAFYLRRTAIPTPISYIGDSIRSLVDHGLLEVMFPEGVPDLDIKTDLAYMWKGYFKITPRGRNALSKQAHEITEIINGQKQ